MFQFLSNLLFGSKELKKPKTPEYIKEEVLSPSEYQRILLKEGDNIETVKIIPPRLGSGGLGKVKVTYKKARLINVRPVTTKRVTFFPYEKV